jgi:hypothetical protein
MEPHSDPFYKARFAGLTYRSCMVQSLLQRASSAIDNRPNITILRPGMQFLTLGIALGHHIILQYASHAKDYFRLCVSSLFVPFQPGFGAR